MKVLSFWSKAFPALGTYLFYLPLKARLAAAVVALPVNV